MSIFPFGNFLSFFLVFLFNDLKWEVIEIIQEICNLEEKGTRNKRKFKNYKVLGYREWLFCLYLCLSNFKQWLLSVRLNLKWVIFLNIQNIRVNTKQVTINLRKLLYCSGIQLLSPFSLFFIQFFHQFPFLIFLFLWIQSKSQEVLIKLNDFLCLLEKRPRQILLIW